ncbi:MAG: ATP-binding protein [Eubacterium sp.]|jgi:DNA replication protein DnaC|nr:ATP-binding protein [Eubacterium sp.]
MPLSNSQYDAIIREYHAKQIKNQHMVDNRMKEVYGKDPRLKAIDNAISSCSLVQARRLLGGDVTALPKLRRQLSDFKQQRLDILNELGYSEQYLEPSYECPDCKDTGYIDNERCHCFKQRAIDLVYTQSNIRNILKNENFETFSYDYYSETQSNPATGLSSLETMQNAVKDCQKFINDFDFSFSNLFFYGDTGVGKTFLSNCVAKELLDTGHSVIYFTAFQLFDIFKRNTFYKATEQDIIAAHQNIFDCDLLIIDDLGTEMPNTFTISQLFLCLNERMLRKKSTIISTNLSIHQVAEIYSERTFSRISSNYVMLKLFGDDIRIQKKLR